jgi:uncharacterized alkaline shock family protein YloU
MNGLNRFIVVLLALAFAGAAALVLLVGAGLVAPDRLPLGYWLQNGLGILATPGRMERLPGLAVAGAVLLMSLWLLWLEARSAMKPDPAIVVHDTRNGRVTMARAGVEHLAEKVATEVDGVMEARARVLGAEDIEVRCQARIDPASNAPSLAEQLRERVREAVEAHIGRPVARLSVHTQLDSLKRYRTPSRVQ